MAPIAQNLNNSVAVVCRKLLQMMDALAESGMRQAHREISRAHDVSSAQEQPGENKPRKSSSPPVH